MSGEPQSPLKRSKERILLIKEKARRARNNDRFGGRLDSSVKLGLVSSERASARYLVGLRTMDANSIYQYHHPVPRAVGHNSVATNLSATDSFIANLSSEHSQPQ
jgi:hypothetical protein